MPTSPSPERIAEFLDQVLKIGQEPNLDEFTLNRYLHTLEKLRKDAKFGVSEYVALSKVLYSLGRSEEALALNQEGLRLRRAVRRGRRIAS